MVTLSKTSIQGIGVTLSVAVLAVTGLFIAKPLYDSTNETKITLEEQKMVTVSKTGKLAQLEKGVENIEETQKFVDDFLVSAPNNKDVESASRAISKALISGVKISSFTFGAEENIKESEVPKAALGEFTPPMELSDAAAGAEAPAEGEATGEDGKKEALETFHRMPMQITVNADSYKKLSEYVDKLADQKRLVNIVSVSSTSGAAGIEGESSGGSVEATIYAYSFIYTR